MSCLVWLLAFWHLALGLGPLALWLFAHDVDVGAFYFLPAAFGLLPLFFGCWRLTFAFGLLPLAAGVWFWF